MISTALTPIPLLDGDWDNTLTPYGLQTGDVADVYFCASTYGDYAEWYGEIIGRLTDGRYFAATGWCDTTGWGCRDDTTFESWPDFDTFCHGLGDERRAKLGLGLDGLGSMVVTA